MNSIIPAAKKISVLIPFRANKNVDLSDRLMWRRDLVKSFQDIEFVLVDDGSDEGTSIRELCSDFGIKYIRLETSDAPFSLARARNAGIRAATGEYIYFEDMDFIHKSSFYERLIAFVDERFLEKIYFNFLAVPTLFLTEEASVDLMASECFDKKFDEYIARLPFINPDNPNSLCESYAPVGSNIFLRRDTCFHVGLFDEYFNSWGGEDREFIFRLIYHNSKLLYPQQLHLTKPWKLHRSSAYEGWRSLYRLHGEAMAAMGLYAMHIYHPENPWKEPFSREQNFRYCNDKIAAISSAKRLHIKPAQKDDEPVNVFIGRNILFNNDEVISTLGNVEIIEVNIEIEPVDFAQRILDRSPKSVFFQNPYGNPWLKAVWDEVQANNVRCICAERGAFPGSIYFDSAFCAESQAYAPKNWENAKPIDANAFVSGLQVSNNALEPQGTKDLAALRSQVGSPEKRNVLVLLQSLTDATTLHFTGELPNYSAFLDAIRKLEGVENINLLIKNHPLNKVNPLPGVGIDVSSANIYELFSLANSCVTLNSGGGLLALGAGVPTITMGKCFYAQDGLAIDCPDPERLKTLVDSNLFVDRTKVGQFYSYLLRDFYSFADWTYGSRDNGPNAKMSIMTTLAYHSVKIDGFETRPMRKRMHQNDLLMVPYQLYMYHKRKELAHIEQNSDVEKMLKLVRDLDINDANQSFEIDNGTAQLQDAAYRAYYLGMPDLAAKAFQILAENNPNPNAFRAEAEALIASGNIEDATALYRKALELSPGHRRIIARLGELENDAVKNKIESSHTYRIPRPRKRLA